MRSVERLEHQLASQTKRRHCIAVGRGATGLWVAFDTLKSKTRDKIVFPATLCLSPVVVAQLSGAKPIFCDVDRASGNLAPSLLDDLLSSRNDIAAVLAAHLYGQPAAIRGIVQTCRKHNVPLIEDVAQAFGAEVGGQPLGSFGDIAILSFGHTKIVDAGGGGAILTDDDDNAARLRQSCADLPACPAEMSAWSRDYRTAYYAIAPLAASRDKLRRLLGGLGEVYPGMYRYRLDEATAVNILTALEDTERNVVHRRARAALYRKHLAGLPIEELETSPGGVPWRFNILVAPTLRDGLLASLRAQGFDASSWYPSVPPCFLAETDWRTRWPAAAAIEASIVNLWVDDATTEDRVLACCDAIRGSLENLENRESIGSPS